MAEQDCKYSDTTFKTVFQSLCTCIRSNRQHYCFFSTHTHTHACSTPLVADAQAGKGMDQIAYMYMYVHTYICTKVFKALITPCIKNTLYKEDSL